MVKHVVMWKLKEDKKNEENLTQLKNIIEALFGKIPGLLSIEVGIGYSGFDAVLISTHTDKKALEDYAVHPEHVKVVDFVRSIVETRTACDFEY